MSDYNKIHGPKTDRSILMEDMRTLDVGQLERFLTRKQNSDDPLGEDFKDRIRARQHPEYKYIDTEYGLIQENLEYLLPKNAMGADVLKDIGIGGGRGLAKLLGGAVAIPMALAEKIKLIDDGSVAEFGKAFESYIDTNIGKTEGIAGGLAEGLAQYLVPGIGAYKLMGTIIKGTKLLQRTKKTLAAEAITVGVAQTPTDPTFVSMISDLTGLDTENANTISDEIINSLATPGEWNANDVLTEKFEAIISDAPLAIVLENALRAVPLLVSFAKSLNKINQNPSLVEELSNE